MTQYISDRDQDWQQKPPQIDYHPWRPMQDRAAVKTLGKLAEEAGELVAAASRCIIQGINEVEPVTGKPNKEWLEEEIADVFANADLAIERFKLNKALISKRATYKRDKLAAWHEAA